MLPQTAPTHSHVHLLPLTTPVFLMSLWGALTCLEHKTLPQNTILSILIAHCWSARFFPPPPCLRPTCCDHAPCQFIDNYTDSSFIGATPIPVISPLALRSSSAPHTRHGVLRGPVAPYPSPSEVTLSGSTDLQTPVLSSPSLFIWFLLFIT